MGRREIGLISSTLLVPATAFLVVTALVSDALDLNEFVFHKYTGYAATVLPAIQWSHAGGNWSFGGIRAAALVVFSAPGLTADLVADFYAESATSSNRTQITGESTATLAGTSVRRMDSTTGDRTQTVLVWPAAAADVVNVVITNDLPDPKIEAAVAAFGGG